MQLPRGTFREIKKGETIETLLAELERTRFSGICSTSSGAGTGTLVYKGGKCILVKFLGKSGDAGWDEMLKHSGDEVDAALSTLDDAQIQLSLEFNKTCRLVRAQKPDAEAKRPVPPIREQVKKPAPPIHTAAPAPVAKVPQKPPAASSLFQRPAPPQVTPEPEQRKAAPVFGRPAMPAPPSVAQQAPPPVSQHSKEPEAEHPDTAGQGSVFEKDIDTFDTMDLDNVTDKIRNDCKTMIKQLHLEHLMER